MRSVISEVYAGTYLVKVDIGLRGGTSNIQRLQPTLCFRKTDNSIQCGETAYFRYINDGVDRPFQVIEAVFHFDADTEGALYITQRSGSESVSGDVGGDMAYINAAALRIRVLKLNGGMSDAERQEFADLQRKTDSIRWDRDTSHWTRASRTDWGIVTQSTITDETVVALLPPMPQGRRASLYR